MGYPTNIEWTDATWNPVGGCSIASPGCGPCYAQQLAGTRLKSHPLYRGTTSPSPKDGRPIFNGTMTAAPEGADTWTWRFSWRGVPEGESRVLGAGMPSTIFVGDMSDVYHENHDKKFQNRIVGVIALARAKHIGQLLTKRPHIMVDHILGDRLDDPTGTFGDLRECLWLGTSAERQKEFDERWYHLRKLARLGFVVFISYEPAMGPLVLPPDFLALGDRAQVIAGGCSGDRAWPAHPDWFRSLRDQCGPAGVAFFFKQWGEWLPCAGAEQRAYPRALRSKMENHAAAWPTTLSSSSCWWRTE
ncbi:MAG: DUF5131 family protein [Rhizomicrobium sp.]